MPPTGFNAHRVKRRTLPAAWAVNDIQLLRQLSLQGWTVEAIANRLGRTASAVRNKAGMHGIPVQSQENARRTG